MEGNDVAIHLGNGSGGTGDGTFAPALFYSAGEGSFDLTAADFNSDGFLDIATANLTGGDVSILLNLGFPEPEIHLTPLALDFGPFELGNHSAQQTSVIQNIGLADLLTTTTLTSDGGGAFTLSSLPVSPLAPATSTTLEVMFSTSTLGPVSGELTLLSNDPTSPTVTIALAGTGVDTQAPTSTATGPSGSITQTSPAFEVTFTASDNTGGSGLESVELFYQRNGRGFVSYGTFNMSPIIFDTTTTGSNGTYEFYTIASDTAGNSESKSQTAEISVDFTQIFSSLFVVQ